MILNVIPRDGSNNFSGPFIFSGANGAMQGNNYTQELKDQGLRAPAELHQGVRLSTRWAAAASSATSCGSTSHIARPGERARSPGMWFNKNAGNPNAWTVDFDRDRPAYSTTASTERDRAHHVAGHAAQQVLNLTGPSSTHQLHQRAAAPRRRRRKRAAGRSSSRRTCSRPAGRRRSRAGSCWKPAGEPIRPGTGTRSRGMDGSHNDRMIRIAGTGRRDPEPDLPDAGGRGRRLQSSFDRDARQRCAARCRTSPARTT